MSTILKQKYKTEIIQRNASQFIKDLENKNSDSLHYIYQIYAYWLFDNIGTNEAISYENKAFNFSKKHHPSQIKFSQRSGIYLAYYQVKNNEIPQSIKTYEDVILIDNASKSAITAYLKLGYSYLSLKDYYKAIKYNKLALSFLEKEPEQSQQNIREAYQNLAYLNLLAGTREAYQEGRFYGKKADSMVQIIPTSSKNKYLISYLLGQLHNRKEDFQFSSSKFYYDKAYEIAKKIRDTSNLITINLGYGILHKDVNPDKAKEYFNKTIALSKDRDNFLTYQAITNLAYLEDKNSNHDKAINLRHQALQYLSKNDFRNIHQTYDSLINHTSRKKNLLTSLPLLADSYVARFKIENDTTDLEKSIFYFELADEIADALQKNSTELKSRLFWRRLSNTIYDKAIDACFLMGNADKAFYFIEKNKSLLLMEDILNQRFKEQLDPNSDFYKKQLDYEKKRAKLNSLIKNMPRTEAKKDSLSKELIDLDITYENEVGTIIKKNKNYRQTNINSLADAQNSLNNEHVILEYHSVEKDTLSIYPKRSALYLLVITKNNTQLFQLQEPEEIKKNISNYIEKIRRPFYTDQDRHEFIKVSNSLYEQLLPTLALRTMLANNKVQIIPHGKLSSLPFEALNTNNERIQYLIEDTSIEYQYSISFLSNILKKETKEISYSSYVPVEFSNQNLMHLPNSIKEIEVLNKKFKGTTYQGDLATKKAFLNNRKKGILHLATHADSPDSISPWIAFRNEKLYLEEIYGINTSTDLVVLSACNTNIGKDEAGEGIMSLGRAFFFAGTQSVLASLWNINDQSSTRILNDFYRYTASGSTKSEALRLSKLQYLKDHSNAEISPYYWASFIVIGNDMPLLASKNNIFIYSTLAIFVLLIIIFLILRLRKQRFSW